MSEEAKIFIDHAKKDINILMQELVRYFVQTHYNGSFSINTDLLLHAKFPCYSSLEASPHEISARIIQVGAPYKERLI